MLDAREMKQDRGWECPLDLESRRQLAQFPGVMEAEATLREDKNRIGALK